MLKNRGISLIIIAVISVVALLLGNTMMDSGTSYADIADGIYEGKSDAGMHPGLKVAVEFLDGKITSVEVVEHGETEGISDPAIEGIPVAIVGAGSPEVDVVSGATMTSNAIIEAVKNVISGDIVEPGDSSEEEPEEVIEIVEPQIDLIADGTYEGVSDAGMHPDLKVSVTVEGGKIVEVKVISHDETEGISDPAIEGVPLAIVEENKTGVDVVSGATYTSNAIMEATRNALESAK